MADKKIEPKRPEKDEPAAGARKAERKTVRARKSTRKIKRVARRAARTE